jgi:hypothetical protein
MEVLVAPARVPDPVRRNERKAEPFREIDERAVAVLLVTETMALDLDVEPAGKDRGESFEKLARGVGTGLCQSAPGGTLLAARQTVKTVRVRRDLFEADPPLAFRAPERAARDQAAEVPVARSALDEEGEATSLVIPSGALSVIPSGALSVIPSGALSVIPSGALSVIPSGARNLSLVRERSFASLGTTAFGTTLFEGRFRPHESLDPRLLRCLVEPGRSVDAVRVDERDRGKAAVCGLFDQVLRKRRTVEKREGRRRAELGVRARLLPRRRGAPGPLPELLLARAGGDDPDVGVFEHPHAPTLGAIKA